MSETTRANEREVVLETDLANQRMLARRCETPDVGARGVRRVWPGRAYRERHHVVQDRVREDEQIARARTHARRPLHAPLLVQRRASRFDDWLCLLTECRNPIGDRLARLDTDFKARVSVAQAE